MSEQEAGEARQEEQGSKGTRNGLSGGQIVQRARQHIEELTGRRSDTISGINRTDDGWTVSVEVVELNRIPPSTDVLASYEVNLDGDGELLDFQRGRRYYRSQADED